MDKLSNFKKHTQNPFIEEALETVQGNITKKYKTASGTSQKAILHAVDENGEILGHTTFVKQVEVDEQQFVKLYVSNISNFFDLDRTSMRVLGYILSILKPNQDKIIFELTDSMKYTGYSTKSSIYKGLAQLVKHKIIAKSHHDFLYYINPMVFFNGNRITFANSYIKKQSEEQKQIKDSK